MFWNKRKTKPFFQYSDPAPEIDPDHRLYKVWWKPTEVYSNVHVKSIYRTREHMRKVNDRFQRLNRQSFINHKELAYNKRIEQYNTSINSFELSDIHVDSRKYGDWLVSSVFNFEIYLHSIVNITAEVGEDLLFGYDERYRDTRFIIVEYERSKYDPSEAHLNFRDGEDIIKTDRFYNSLDPDIYEDTIKKWRSAPTFDSIKFEKQSGEYQNMYDIPHELLDPVLHRVISLWKTK